MSSQGSAQTGYVPASPHPGSQRPVIRLRSIRRVAHLGRKTGPCLGSNIRIREVGELPGLVRIVTIRSDGNVDEPRIFLTQLPVSDPPGIHLPRGKGFNDNGGLLGQSGKFLSVLLRSLEVQSQVPFIAPFNQERNAHSFDVGSVRGDLPRRIPLGGFDLDDFSPELGKEAARYDAGKIRQAYIQDQDLVQNFGFPFRVHDLSQPLPPGSKVLLGLPRSYIAGVYLFLLPFAAHFLTSLP